MVSQRPTTTRPRLRTRRRLVKTKRSARRHIACIQAQSFKVSSQELSWLFCVNPCQLLVPHSAFRVYGLWASLYASLALFFRWLRHSLFVNLHSSLGLLSQLFTCGPHLRQRARLPKANGPTTSVPQQHCCPQAAAAVQLLLLPTSADRFCTLVSAKLIPVLTKAVQKLLSTGRNIY